MSLPNEIKCQVKKNLNDIFEEDDFFLEVHRFISVVQKNTKTIPKQKSNKKG